MSRVRTVVTALAMTAVWTVMGDPAAAMDLTGTWEGTAKCTQYTDDEKPQSASLSIPLQITHVTETGFYVSFGMVSGFGTVADNGTTGSKGFVAMTGCPSSPVAFFATGKVTIGNDAKISGDLSFFNPDVIAVCKLKLERTSTDDPGVDACASGPGGVTAN